MYIVDRNQDFYDHYSYVYGVDKSVIYDRRDSTRLTNDMVCEMSLPRVGAKRIGTYYGLVFVEIGTVQYIVRIGGIEFRESEKYRLVELYSGNAQPEIVRTFNEHRHVFGAPVSIRYVLLQVPFCWWLRDSEEGRKERRKKERNFYESITLDEALQGTKNIDEIDIVNNPIFANTFLTSVLDGDSVWKELQNYISSIDNDKDVSIAMTDKDKAEIHGFDKHSFRHPVN